MPTIPYTKQTWTDGSAGGTPISAARLAVIESGIHEAHLAPAVRVTHNANQSITTATATVLAFNTERFDTCAGSADTQHDTVTNNSRLTCRYAGKYQITGNIEWASSPTTGIIQVLLNGSTVIANVQATTDLRVMSVSTLYELAVNDYVQLRVSQFSGASINVLASANYSPEFMMVRVA